MSNKKLEKRIGYSFDDPALLTLALTHSSYVHSIPNHVGLDNERLEFIGDAYLDAIIGKALYQKLRESSEGYLSKKRSEVVCQSSLARISRKLGIGEFLKIGMGEEHIGGRDKDSLLADALEAIIGAMVLDGGYEIVEEVVLPWFQKTIELALQGELFTNYKSYLQEVIHKVDSEDAPKYNITKEEGPSHNKTFYVNVTWRDKVIGKGMGSSKKQAEQEAAKMALERTDFDVV